MGLVLMLGPRELSDYKMLKLSLTTRLIPSDSRLNVCANSGRSLGWEVPDRSVKAFSWARSNTQVGYPCSKNLQYIYEAIELQDWSRFCWSSVSEQMRKTHEYLRRCAGCALWKRSSRVIPILSICTSIGTRANAPIPETDTFRFGSFICQRNSPLTDEMYTKEYRQSLVVKERDHRVLNSQWCFSCQWGFPFPTVAPPPSPVAPFFCVLRRCVAPLRAAAGWQICLVSSVLHWARLCCCRTSWRGRAGLLGVVLQWLAVCEFPNTPLTLPLSAQNNNLSPPLQPKQ